MNDQRLSYNDILLGDSMNIILEATQSTIPKIQESDFKARVLPLLQRPFHRAHLNAYVRVVGELTNPLHVVSDDNPNEVLHVVPALIQTTGTSLPPKGGATVDMTMRAIYNEGERGIDIHPMIADFLTRITSVKDIRESVLNPLRAILNHYGLEIDISDETDLVTDVPSTQKATASVDTDHQSSFTDEYE